MACTTQDGSKANFSNKVEIPLSIMAEGCQWALVSCLTSLLIIILHKMSMAILFLFYIEQQYSELKSNIDAVEWLLRLIVNYKKYYIVMYCDININNLATLTKSLRILLFLLLLMPPC